jgi:hypothetical protein
LVLRVVLDPTQRFTVADVPGVWIFPDDGDAAGFYALPAAPRIALDEAGRPQLGLVLYGKTSRGSFVANGGILTLTTSLGLTEDEGRTLIPILSRRLASAAAGDAAATGGAEAPEPTGDTSAVAALPAAHLLAADAVAAEVEVRLAEGVALTGAASLGADFRCSFNLKLDAAQARSLQSAWDAGLSEAQLSYRLSLRPGPSSSSIEVGHVAWSKRSDDHEEEHGLLVGATASSSSAAAQTLTLDGPLTTAGSLADLVQHVDL